MPKKVPNYNNSSIYKLVHNDDTDNTNIYIGSTTNIIQRKYNHKTNCNNTKNNLKVYQHIRANGCFENWVMIQIEPFSCNSKKELQTRERYWIESLKPKLNCQLPTRTYNEWYNDNKEKQQEQQQKYRENNKEKISEKRKDYRQNNKVKIQQCNKKYNENNKEKRQEQKRKYYNDNKEQIAEKVKCDKCGCEVRRCNLVRHKKTIKCCNYVSQS